MIKHKYKEDRDEVLFAFQQACECPTADQIIEWTRRYPQFAEDIRAHAAIARDWEARKNIPVEEPDQIMLARGFSRVLNALYNAEIAASANNASSQPHSFQQMMKSCDTDVPKLARELKIARSVLADLFNGVMLAPVGKRLAKALIRVLRSTQEAFDKALLAALTAPRIGHAKASGTPTIIPRSYAEIIRESGMSEEQMHFWLTEDE